MKAGTLEIELLTNLAKLQSEMEQIKRSVGGMETEVSRKTKAANDNLASLGNTAKLGKHHVQNLAFQFQDLGVQLASAAGSSAPLKMTLMALFQQGTQISGIMSQAGLSVKGLIGQVLAMAAPFAPVIATVGALAGAMALVTDEINKNSKVTVTWTDTVLGTFDVVREYVSGKLTSAFAYFGTSTGAVWDYVVTATKAAINFIIGASQAVPNVISATWRLIGPAMGDAFYSGVNLVADALQAMLDKAASAVNGVTGFFNDAFGTSIPQVVAASIPKIANPYTGAMSALGKAGAKALVGSFTTDYLGDFAETVSGAAQKRAYERLAKEAAKGGKDAGKSAGKAVVDETAKAWAEVIKQASDTAKEVAKALADNLKTSLSQMQDEIARGTSPWLQAANDNAKATANWNTELQETIRLLDGLGGFGSVLGNIGAIFEAIGSGNWQNVNGPLGIIGKSLGGVLNNTYTTGMDDNGRWIKSFGEILSEKLDAVFGGQGSFAKVLQSAGVGMAAGQLINGSKNSGLGSAIGGALGDKIGTKVFSKGFESIAKGLGDFAGPLGSIVGGVLGGVVGSLFKKTTSGYASVTNKGVTSGGNDASLAASSKTSGSGIQSAIAGIADQLGGTVGDYAVAIGKRSSGWIKVSASGNGQAAAGKKVTSDIVYNGKDEAEALRIAVLNAIQDGAIQGVRAGTQALLSKNGDIEAQLAKALQFENVFTTLKQKTDPLGYALGQIDRQFTKLKTVFDEAGATAADYAQLEQLIALQRQEAMDEEAARQLDKLNERRNLEVRLMEAQGNAAGALALQRTIERSETEASLRGLMDQIYAAEDLATAQQAAAAAAEAAQAKFRSFATDLRKFANELTGVDGVASYRGSRAQLMATGALAAAGNVEALSNLTGVAQAFIDLAKDQSSTAAQYQREVAMVRSYLNTAIAVADGGTITGLAGASGTTEQIAAANGQVNASLLSEIQALRAEVSAQRAEVRAANESLVISNNKMMRLQERQDRGGSIAVVTDDDRPIKTVAA